MPVISISRPRNTNSGTASKMMCDMPSSMRPMMTVTGRLVVSDRKPKVARPNDTAIGMPISTVTKVTPTKKITKFTLPSPLKTGPSAANTAHATATEITAVRTWRQSPTLTSLMAANTAIKASPTGNAAARHAFEISSDGVVTITSSAANS